MRAIDRIGQQWGSWTILRPLVPEPGGPTMFLCRCRCNAEKPVIGSAMYRGLSKSCKSCAARTRPRSPEPHQVVADRYDVCHREIGYAVKFLGWAGMIDFYERKKAKAPAEV